MNKGALSVIAVLLLLGAGAWYVTTYISEKPLSNEEDLAVRSLVTGFGAHMRFVPLLASSAERRVAMEEHYGPYLSPELIAAWAPEGTEGALGRYTSSPSPERIEIHTVRKTAPTSFTVEAGVIETVNSASSTAEIAAIYPVTFGVQKQGDRLVIVSATKGAYSEIPHRQTIVGYWECLPHADTTGPQTEECAFGIAVDQSNGHFSVNTSLMSTYPVDFATGTKVRVSGVVTPVNQLSSDHWQKYDIDGIISATVIERVE